MDSLIRVIEGKLGSGKTFFAIGKAIDALAQGLVVVTNVVLKWPAVEKRLKRMGCVVPRSNYRFVETKAIADDPQVLFGVLCKHAFLLIDEIHLIFDSRNWAANSDKGGNFQVLITQARKLHIDMWFISQASARIDGRIRDQATHVVRCTNWRQLPILGTLFRFPITLAKICQPNGKDVLARDWIWRSAKIGNCYDTHQTFLGIQLDGDPPALVRGKRRRELGYGLILAAVGSVMLIIDKWMDAREAANRKNLPMEMARKAAGGVTVKGGIGDPAPVKPPVMPVLPEVSEYEAKQRLDALRENRKITRRQQVRVEDQLPPVYRAYDTRIVLVGGYSIRPGAYWLDGIVTGWQVQGGSVLVSLDSKVIPEIRLFYGQYRRPIQYDYDGGILRGAAGGVGGATPDVDALFEKTADGHRRLNPNPTALLNALTKNIGNESPALPGNAQKELKK